MLVFKPPKKVLLNRHSVFLAGSIEMGKAIDWQTHLTESLSDLDIIVLNPRRDDWDSSWNQSIDSPKFVEQVSWELNMLEACDTIVMYFDPSTKSPISLLELGLHASSGKLIVCCPPGFWRKGNVDIVCARNNIPMVTDLQDLIKIVQVRLAGKNG